MRSTTRNKSWLIGYEAKKSGYENALDCSKPSLKRILNEFNAMRGSPVQKNAGHASQTPQVVGNFIQNHLDEFVITFLQVLFFNLLRKCSVIAVY